MIMHLSAELLLHIELLVLSGHDYIHQYLVRTNNDHFVQAKACVVVNLWRTKINV